MILNIRKLLFIHVTLGFLMAFGSFESEPDPFGMLLRLLKQRVSQLAQMERLEEAEEEDALERLRTESMTNTASQLDKLFSKLYRNILLTSFPDAINVFVKETPRIESDDVEDDDQGFRRFYDNANHTISPRRTENPTYNRLIEFLKTLLEPIKTLLSSPEIVRTLSLPDGLDQEHSGIFYAPRERTKRQISKNEPSHVNLPGFDPVVLQQLHMIQSTHRRIHRDKKFPLGLDTVPRLTEILGYPKEVVTKRTFRQFLEAIVPGTKWCGPGNISEDGESLGKLRDLDSCCRQHDRCPESIPAGEEKYGLYNNGFFTRSSCACDSEFKKCLKNLKESATADVAQAVGITYFDILEPQCLRKVDCPAGSKQSAECQCIYEWSDNIAFGST